MTTNQTIAPAACKLTIPVVFNYGMRSEFRLLPGSIVEWTPEDGNLIRIHDCGSSKVISMNDAIPMDWDPIDAVWYES